MNKQALLDQLINALQLQLETAQLAAKQAYESATHQENIAENKYDTLGLEASYLAQGQAKRVEQCVNDLQLAHQLYEDALSKQQHVKTGSFVCLINALDEHSFYLIMPVAGGAKLRYQGKQVIVISPKTPLGSQLMGCRVNDEVTLTTHSATQYFEIFDIA